MVRVGDRMDRWRTSGAVEVKNGDCGQRGVAGEPEGRDQVRAGNGGDGWERSGEGGLSGKAWGTSWR